MIKVTLVTNSGRTTVMASEDASIREVLEENDVNYAVGVTSIDGCPLKGGEMDKSLSDMGVTEKCFLSVVVKADNAASAMIAGGAVVITSALKRSDIELVKKYRKNALTLFEGEGKDKEPVFCIDLTENSAGHINNNGVTFGPTASADGNATVTLIVDPDIEDVAEFFADKYGSALLQLQKLEETIPAQLEEIHAEATTVKGMIARL